MSTRNGLVILSAILALVTQPKSRAFFYDVPDSLVDVFPLKTGLTYTYDFSDSSLAGDDFFLRLYTHRGRIQYHIVDSSVVQDSTVVWNIREYRNFQGRNAGIPASMVPDTTYHVSDTVSLQLIESLSGRHALICGGTIWKFPLSHFLGLMPILRYQDSSKVTLAWAGDSVPGAYRYASSTDTLNFSLSSGFSRRRFKESWSNTYHTSFYSLTAIALGDPTGVAVRSDERPNTAQLYQNFPNPFNPSTTLSFTLNKGGFVSLQIVDLLGRIVQTLQAGNLGPGSFTVSWNGHDHPSGVYFCTLRTNEYSRTIKLLLTK